MSYKMAEIEAAEVPGKFRGHNTKLAESRVGFRLGAAYVREARESGAILSV